MVSNLHRFAARRPSAADLRALAFLLAVVFYGSSAHAQSINPSTVSFLPSPDNDSVDSSGQPLVTSYNFGIYPLGATQPYTILNLGKPAPGSDGYITVNFASMLSSPPLPGQTLEGRVAAVGPGGTGESTWSNTFVFNTTTADAPPSVQLTSPTGGSTFTTPASITIAGAAADSDGTISRIDLYANGALIGSASASPFGMTWPVATAGSYALTAVATDNGGLKTTSTPVSVAVQAPPTSGADAPPAVQVTSPTSGSMIAVGAPITIAASASDSDGTIGRVDFYVNGALVATDAAAPYTAVWTPGSMGNYTITAVATDNVGVKTTSNAVSVKVRRKTR